MGEVTVVEWLERALPGKVGVVLGGVAGGVVVRGVADED